MKLHSFGSLLGPTDRERRNLSGGEVESHFLPLGIPLLLSHGHREKWLSVFAYSAFSDGVFCFYTIMTSNNFEQAWSNVSLTRAR